MPVYKFVLILTLMRDILSINCVRLQVSRCVDIGKYALEGSVERQCIHGQWTGNKSVCVGLNQESNYSRK